ncbi:MULTISPECIES: hypothetical protein [Aerosakkonema]|uniref:hypothetical protein n=1 Tax=Aerosakkonema TaxID=1246629 RepID=UPI0035B742CA
MTIDKLSTAIALFHLPQNWMQPRCNRLACLYRRDLRKSDRNLPFEVKTVT